MREGNRREDRGRKEKGKGDENIKEDEKTRK